MPSDYQRDYALVESSAPSITKLSAMENIPELFQGIFETTVGIVLFVLIALWSMAWKLVALYRSASRGQKAWFVAIFFLNTVGILEIVYMAFFSRPKQYRSRR